MEYASNQVPDDVAAQRVTASLPGAHGSAAKRGLVRLSQEVCPLRSEVFRYSLGRSDMSSWSSSDGVGPLAHPLWHKLQHELVGRVRGVLRQSAPSMSRAVCGRHDVAPQVAN